RRAEFHQHGNRRRRHAGHRVRINGGLGFRVQGSRFAREPGTGSREPGAARAYLDLARPFTLVAPALGFMSGALTAVGAAPRESWRAALLAAPFMGSAMAALLNAGQNAPNPTYDPDLDRVNNPKRTLPGGPVT